MLPCKLHMAGVIVIPAGACQPGLLIGNMWWVEWKLPAGMVLSLINIWIGWVSWCSVAVKYNACCVSFWKLCCHTVGRKRNILADSRGRSLHMLRGSFPGRGEVGISQLGGGCSVRASASAVKCACAAWPGGSCSSNAVLSLYHLKSANVTGILKAQKSWRMQDAGWFFRC